VLAFCARSTPGAGGVDGPRLLGYAFGSMNREVTIFDAATLQPRETRPLGVTVRWLGNAQHSWDGRSIWTYDQPGPEMLVEVVAVDPGKTTVARRFATGKRGPSWGVELMPDQRTAWMAMAGDDVLTVIDLAAGEVVAEVGVGNYP
jgi:DNA-binding beta-propeller fold protein YncE